MSANLSRIDCERHDWGTVRASLDAKGYAVLPGLLDRPQCDRIAALFDDDRIFRAHIHMARHNFGRGEYKYLAYPLPSLIEGLRHDLYRRLAPTANVWSSRLGLGAQFPAELSEFLERCHAAGQRRPTPLLLRYREGDYNCLHQDLYGDHAFPLQVVVMLSDPSRDFEGGDLILVENRPRMQSIGHVVRPDVGDAVILAVNQRPQRGVRGDFRVSLRHGVTEVTAGMRHTLGLILHDAA